MTTTQAAQTTIYYAPYIGNYVPIYNGTTVVDYSFTASATDTVGQSLVLGSSWAANTLFDVYETLVTGTPTLCTVAWTNSTTRATALARYAGIRTNAATATCQVDNSTTTNMIQYQGTYLGSFYTNGSTGTVDYIFGGSSSGGTAASLGVWNAYNRVVTSTNVTDSGTSYTYATATVRQARASAGNQVSFISGIALDSITVATQMSVSGTSSTIPEYGYGLDATNAFSGEKFYMDLSSGGFTSIQTGSSGIVAPQIGKHTISLNEESGSANTITFDVISQNRLSVSILN
jgi:hypothetical protein